MIRPKRFVVAPLLALLGAGGLASLALDSTGCTSSTDAPPAAEDSGTDAAPSKDGSAPIGDAGPDGTVRDGAPEGDANTGTDGDVGDGGDAGIDCAAVVARLLSSPIAPPSSWLGLDLSKGGVADGGTGSGGLTIDETGILACASSVEPDVLEAGASPNLPGARTATFTNGAGASVTIAYNLESRVIWQALTNAPATSTLSFHARAGGAYGAAPDGGLNEYVIGFVGGDGGAGYVTKNGADFPADWSSLADDGGAFHASAWANEIYDGIMATYASTTPAVADCMSAPYTRPVVPQVEPACIFFNGFLGVRPLGTYIQFAQDTNEATGAYEFWRGGWPTCATPRAAIDNIDYLPISASGNYDPQLGTVWSGAGIGPLFAAEAVGNPSGMLSSEANAIAGCGGTSVAAPDPGYSAQQFGSGEVEVEYNADSGVAYKVIAKQGYQGGLSVGAPEDDGGQNNYGIQVGSVTLNGAQLTLDWNDGDAGTLNAAITDISNGWLAYTCGAVDTDCVQAGDCTIVPDDGQGHSTFTLQLSPALAGECWDFHPLTFVFPKGSSAVSEIYATNPAGQ